MQKFLAVILAAGKGRRLGSFHGNKVLAPLNGRPLISYAVELFNRLKIKICVVVGYGKDEVKKSVGGRAIYVYQEEQLGTGNAVFQVLRQSSFLPKNIIVVMGDHAFSLSSSLIKKILDKHLEEKADVTILTVITKNVYGYGLILREGKDNIVKILDGKHITPPLLVSQGEVSPGVYVFKTSFLQKYLSRLPRHERSGEYYLSDLIMIAAENNLKIAWVTSRDENLALGINTFSDLEKAKNILNK